MLVPLHVKSAYSLGIGTAPVERLVERASALGVEAMALTDADNLYGALVFHRLARARGIQPILGVELPLAGTICGPERLVLLARDRSGYENLCRIVTRRKLDESFDTLAALPALAGGLFILTGRRETMERLRALPGIDRTALRFLLVRPGVESTERRLLEAAAEWEIPVAADADIGFLDPGDHPLHRLLFAIRERGLASEVKEPPALGPHRHFPGPREWAARFADLPEAVRESERIAGMCSSDLWPARRIFPRIELPPGETAYSALARRSIEGLRRRYPCLGSRAPERLTAELGVIERLGFCEYFLVVGDIVERARRRGIEVVGRGSGASSIVAYLLGVTNVDPIAHGLQFERFLHAERPDLPDIDIDLCWIRRDEVIADVYRAYGDDRVAMISSHLTFQPRSAFREAALALGAPAREVDRHSKRMPHSLLPSPSPGEPSGSLEETIAASPLCRDLPRREEPYRSAIAFAQRLIGLPRHLSIHPGGIVIGEGPLEACVPLERSRKGVVVTQYDMHSIEDVGLVKIDLLGNRCLTELQETLESVREGKGVALELAGIPDRDPAAAALLAEGRTVGCFQIESPAMRALLRQLRVESVRECIVAVALIRPGPSQGGMKERYLRRAAGEERVEYLCPRLREVLEESHGIILYEEDVMRVAAAVGGLSLAEGDVLRSRLAKGPGPEELRELENDFVSRAIGGGVAHDAASAVWADLIRFSRYTFNKAHAAGYGVLAYQAAYLKAHYPVEYACALLNNHAGMYDPRTIAEEARRQGVALLPPCANRSGARHRIEEGAVRLALSQVKGLSAQAIQSILAARPFRSLGDLLRRTRIPQREVEALVLAGGLDFTGLNRPQLVWELESTYRGQIGRGELGLAGAGGEEWSTPRHPALRDYPPLERVRQEMRLLDLAVSAHPLALLRDRLTERGCLPIAAALERPGSRLRVAGLIAATRQVRARSGRMMGFLSLEDETGLLESTLFPDAFRRFAPRISGLGPYLLEGDLEERRRALSLDIRTLERLESVG